LIKLKASAGLVRAEGRCRCGAGPFRAVGLRDDDFQQVEAGGEA
jgi:hypothetical protein